MDQQAHTLKHAADGVRRVLAALARLPVRAAVDPNLAAQARDAAMAYFTKRLMQVQYAAFQQAGCPIGSGSTESANKVVVEMRLKGRGMHWAREHGNPLVAPRTVACANRWAEVWPRISARSEAEERRRMRWRARHPTLPTPPAEHPPPPATVSVKPPASANATPASRGKSIVNGRPTALHVWKRYGSFASGRRPQGRPR